jgi:putrescine aminotransferase
VTQDPKNEHARSGGGLLGFDGATRLDAAAIAETYRDHHFGGLNRVAALLGANLDVVAAHGPWLELSDGSRLFDAHQSNGAVAFGHNHPGMIEAAKNALSYGGVGLPGPVPSRVVAGFCRDLVAIAPNGMSRAILYNSGAEAIEGALVVACLAQGKRDVFVGFEGGFHGKTAAARAVGGIASERRGFPDWAATETLPYGDLDAAVSFLDKNSRRVSAVVVEPLQSNGGLRIPPEGFLAGLAEACRRAGALLVVDEVSTGLGRTGLLFECQREGVVPDLLCLAKCLSGGIVPIGTVLVGDGLAKVMAAASTASHFATTFSGAAISTAVGLEVLRTLVKDDVPARVAALGQRLEAGLRDVQARHPRLVRDVRGRGLLWGIELADPADLPGRFLPGGFADFLTSRFGGSVAIAMQRYTIQAHRALLAPTASDRRVVRLFPPLNSEPADIDHLVSCIEGSLADGLSAWVRNLT